MKDNNKFRILLCAIIALTVLFGSAYVLNINVLPLNTTSVTYETSYVETMAITEAATETTPEITSTSVDESKSAGAPTNASTDSSSITYTLGSEDIHIETETTALDSSSTTADSSSVSGDDIYYVSGSDNSEKVVHMSIDGAGEFSDSGDIPFTSGMTAYDALRNYCNNMGYDISASGAGSLIYVSSINGLSERAYGATSGWIYSVNGNEPNKGAASYKIKEGDDVHWYYSKSE